MPSQVAVAALLALGAAVVFAGAAALQRSAARVHVDLAERGLAGLPVLLGRLLRRPRWWWGWAATVTGFALQAAALRLASVGVVQPVVALQVVVALLALAWRHRRPPAWSGLLGCLALASGAGAVLALVAGLVEPPPTHLGLALGIAFALVVLAVAGARRLPGTARGPLLGATTGVCCGVTAVLLDAVVDRAAAAPDLLTAASWLLHDWRPAALVGAVLLSTLVGQAALATGRLPATLAVLTAVNPAASIAISAAAAGVLPGTPTQVLGIVGAAAAMLVGAALVARAAALVEGVRPG
ncbi:hypothetical protein GCM10022215_29030 [Nocardioides fonticola]|uniref:Integral membrane protein n=1 Tax=Nocardioides fonticola TaxID=450363 RepID=A0ABP7XNM8_9ACTN